VTAGSAARPTARTGLRLLGPLLAVASRLFAQDSPSAIQPKAEVGSLEFRFAGTRSFFPSDLSELLELKGRGSFYHVRQLLGKLPVVNPPAIHPFDPVELQKDVVRLVRFYRRSGFLRPAVDYEVNSNPRGTVVNVTFVIDEGPPLLLRQIAVADSAGGSPDLPDELQSSWRSFEALLATAKGQRFGDADVLAAERRTAIWLQDHGYPFATVKASRVVDSALNAEDVTLVANQGRRRRFGPIAVEGNASVPDQVVLRELPFRTGDWYSRAAMARGRTRLQTINAFGYVVVAIDSAQASDSAVRVRIRVHQRGPRLSLAEVGYVSSGAGLTANAQWTHPNFTGGARSLTASLQAQSGAGAVGTVAERLLGGSLNLTQPYVFVPQLSLVAGPFAEYRDDLEDRSTTIGLSASAIYGFAPLSSLALQYRYAARRISEYRGGIASGNLSLIKLLSLHSPSLLDSLGTDEEESSLTLNGAFTKVDDLANPHRGWTFRPRVKLTMPSGLNTSEFVRADLTATRFQPVSSTVVLAARLSVGRLFPLGKSVPAPGSDPALSFLHLRRETMTAGGTNDVRGWGDRLLGPKFPNVQVQVQGSDTILTANQYVPLGELVRVTASLELRFPAPGLPPNWAAHVFVDGGRVWTPDVRFMPAVPQYEGTDPRFSAGGGVSYQTPVGAVRVSLGCKLNPSVLDLRDPGRVLDAIVRGAPPSSVAPEWMRRFQLHVSLGVAL
jgi:outer membrane protein assembly complex protein YaeT